jgi:1-acyl-sn-glycerol-3-phosphate acyltransferase
MDISSKKMMYWFSRPLVLSYTTTMLEMSVHRHQPFPEGPKIIAANHPSTTDPFFVAAALRQQTFILINELLFQVPLLGAYLRRSGHIPVRAGDGQAALETARDYLEAGHTVLIFPEGDLSPIEGGFHPARSGVARLALMSGAPVIPVGIHLFSSHNHSIRSTVRGRVEYGRWYLHGPYQITTGRPLRFWGDIEDRPYVRSVATNIMRHIVELARESENRLTPAPGGLTGVSEAF